MKRILKFILPLLVILLFIFIFANHTSQEREKRKVEKIIIEYKELLCNVNADDKYLKMLRDESSVEDVEKQLNEYLNQYKPYFTEKGFISLRNNRFIDIYRKAVLSEEGKVLKLSDIKFKKITSNADEKKIVVDYIVHLHLMNESMGEIKEFEELNQAILTKENGHWKIRRDTINIDREMMKLL